MSHVATKWAFDQPEIFTDMKPNEWAVLMVLADCHNPVNGCFPSQDYICRKTNLAERSVREQLGRLRERGLVIWEEARENGHRGANRYLLGFETGFQPANPAGRSCADATSKNEPEQPADSDTSNRQNLPPNLVREPVKEPERERGREEDRQEAVRSAGPNGELEKYKPEGLSKRAEALFYRAFKAWDRFDTSPKQPMLAAWGKLTWTAMEAAADAVPRFLAGCRANGMKHAPAISKYLDQAERLWEGFPAVPEKPADVDAPVFGPLWSAVRFRALLIDPPSTARPRPSAFMAGLLARDDAEGASARRGQQALYGWPGVNAMHISAENRRGIRVAAGSPLLALAERMEPVPVDGPVWEAWRDEHERRGWPWLPDPGAMRVVWFPAGGPEGLAAFEAAVRGQCEDKDHDGGGRQAAE